MTCHSTQVRPFAASVVTATVASADFCRPLHRPCNRCSPFGQSVRSPRVRRATFAAHTRRIYFLAFRMAIGLRPVLLPRPVKAASYAVSVRRATALPTASFGFRLATDTLAVQLTVPTIRVRRGLSPLGPFSRHHSGRISASQGASRHAWRTTKKAGAIRPFTRRVE